MTLERMRRDRQRDLLAILAACGIDSHDVPRDTSADWDGERLALERFERDEDGRVRANPATGEIATRKFFVEPPLELIPD